MVRELILWAKNGKSPTEGLQKPPLPPGLRPGVLVDPLEVGPMAPMEPTEG